MFRLLQTSHNEAVKNHGSILNTHNVKMTYNRPILNFCLFIQPGDSLLVKVQIYFNG